MMLMTNDVLAQQMGPTEGGMTSLLPREQRNIMNNSAMQDSPFAVAIEDIVVQETVSEIAPVQYTMRLSIPMLKNSWTISPHRYSDFENLHKKLLSSHETRSFVGMAELPQKHLLIPTRTALIQRAVGLQRYCMALLRNPQTLDSQTLTSFFELDEHLIGRMSASDKKKLTAAMQKHMMSPKLRSRSETAKQAREAEHQADRALPKSTTFRSPKRGADDLGERRVAIAARLKRTEDEEEPGPFSPMSRMSKSSAPPLSALHADAWSRLLHPIVEHEGYEGESSAWSQLVTRPLLDAAQDAAALWGERAKPKGGEAAKPTGDEAAKEDDLDVPETPLTRDLPLTRSGVSDVMGAIGLA